MQKQTVRVYGILIAVLAIGGFFIKDGHLFGLMNADTMLDWLRVLAAGLLLYAGYLAANNVGLLRGSLVFVGILYVGLALLGLVNSELWGALPNGLTGFDIAFHLLTGVAALGVAMQHETHGKLAAHA